MSGLATHSVSEQRKPYLPSFIKYYFIKPSLQPNRDNPTSKITSVLLLISLLIGNVLPIFLSCKSKAFFIPNSYHSTQFFQSKSNAKSLKGSIFRFPLKSSQAADFPLFFPLIK